MGLSNILEWGWLSFLVSCMTLEVAIQYKCLVLMKTWKFPKKNLQLSRTTRRLLWLWIISMTVRRNNWVRWKFSLRYPSSMQSSQRKSLILIFHLTPTKRTSMASKLSKVPCLRLVRKTITIDFYRRNPKVSDEWHEEIDGWKFKVSLVQWKAWRLKSGIVIY